MLTRRRLLESGLAAGAASLLGCRGGGTRLGTVEGATSAERAVFAARRFAGTTLSVGWESGPQAQDLLRFSGPLWEKLTGIRVNLVEMGSPIEQFRRLMAEHRAGSGAVDCAGIAPAWLPDFVAADALVPLDDYVTHYGVPADFDDFLPLYRSLGTFGGHRYGLFDDGDVLLVYYRRDLFEDDRHQRDFAARFGRPLGDPRTFDWQQFADAARFFTERFAPRLYGFAPFNNDLRWGWFQALLRMNGGRFFDRDTMRPAATEEPGRRTLAALAGLESFIAPGLADVGGLDTMLAAYLSGGAAMASFWPPLGRWAEGYGKPSERLQFVPPTDVAGRTGYALLPGGRTELAVGFLLSVFRRSARQEAAYLFLQWLTSPSVSLQRVMLPYTLRDPYRLSHVASPAYRALWPSAPAYLDTLRDAADKALLDLTIPGANDYAEAFLRAATDVRLGTDVPTALGRMAGAWEAVTERYGRARQRTAYEAFLRMPGAMPPAAGGVRE